MDLLVFIAALPVVLICLFVYKKDIEKEPKTLLKKLMLWGVFSIIPVIFAELVLDIFFNVTGDESLITIVLYCFVGIGLIEELAKWIISNKVVYKNKEFNESYDAIVYSVFVSLGFALIENILYVLSNGVVTGLLRAFTSVPAHTCTGVLMGYYLGKSKNEEINNNQSKSNKYMLLSIFMPSVIHTFYDAFAFSKAENSLTLFIACTVCLYIISLVLINKVSKENVKFEGCEISDGQNFKYAIRNILIITALVITLSIILKII